MCRHYTRKFEDSTPPSETYGIVLAKKDGRTPIKWVCRGDGNVSDNMTKTPSWVDLVL